MPMSSSVNWGRGWYTASRHLVTSFSAAATRSPALDARTSTAWSSRALPLVSATISRSCRPTVRSSRCTFRLMPSSTRFFFRSSSRRASFFFFIWKAEKCASLVLAGILVAG